MTRTITFGIILIILLSSISFNTHGEDKKNIIIFVDDDGTADYISIQDAINNANENDTIIVFEGTYRENIVINKTVNLKSFDYGKAIIHGVNAKYIVIIEAPFVSLTGFTIENLSRPRLFKTGVDIRSRSINISYCVFKDFITGIAIHCDSWEWGNLENKDNQSYYSNTFFLSNEGHNRGIDISDCSNVSIKKNCFISEELPDPLNNSNFAIYVYNTSNVNISFNEIKNVYRGISVSRSNPAYIKSNKLINVISGFALNHFENGTITDNIITNATWGIDIFGSNNEISHNLIIATRDWSQYGIVFARYSNNNIIDSNYFTHWVVPIVIYGSGNYILRNTFLLSYYDSDFTCEYGEKNFWNENYWDRPRFFPMIIRGSVVLSEEYFRWYNVDWNPVLKPYNIPLL